MFSIVSIGLLYFLLHTSPSIDLFTFERMLVTEVVQAEDKIQSKELRAFAQQAGPARSDELTDELAERYGTPEDCAGFTPGQPPDVSASFDWGDLNSEGEVEACLFHVFSGLNTLSEIEAWLAQEGFGDVFQRDASSVAHIHGVTGDLTQFSMRWDTRENGARYGGWWTRQRLARLSRSTTVTVWHSPENGVTRVIVNNNSIWSK
ncbi:hypothetical protein [Rhodophyticola porphyridii]|uniref:Uncharacterized protein n=1 Tax=Rhodophyticola porphyridii TaxID=1852017 RepID=A0A3L9Y4N5_9RHOB|nr:hypothetical protein [Rhodophyticola porphyridii]RMA43302.1 hypothetical protein D9R08_06745 [Rhodophyticola porphyridii]